MRILLAAASLAVLLPSQQTAKPLTFTEDIAPLVFASCTQCHRPGEAGPFSLLSYRDVSKRARNLLSVMEDRIMPPWHPAKGYGQFKNELRLTDEQIATFRAWVQAGTPEGPPESLPALPEFADGWQLGTPDLIVTTSSAYPVPAGGRDIYRNFSLPLDLPEDKWLTAIEVRPGDREVLHHVLVFLDENQKARASDGRDGKPGFRGRSDGRSQMVAGWAVGCQPEHLPEGLAVKLPKGSDLVLQSHLHPSGRATEEQTTIGLYFAKQPPKRSLLSIQLPPFFGFLAKLDVPAGEADYVLQDSFELPCDVDAVTIGGHAHLLCRSLRMRAVLPNGDEVPLLHIPEWDFDWQNRYSFAEPVRLPKGAVVHAELHYDNSAQNPNNPNVPPQRVKWGRETSDEMGSVTLLVTPADEADLGVLQRALRQQPAKSARAAADRVADGEVDAFDKQFAGYDKDKDGKLSKDEVPRRLQRFFERLDRDEDGQLTLAEAKVLNTLLLRGR